MESQREVRERIRSISSTAQITKAMQMVAASKMRKIQQAAIAARPFVRLCIASNEEPRDTVDFTHPLIEVREVRKRAVILIGSDKGLCGALNSNLFRLAAQFDPASTVFITAGRKAAQFVTSSGRRLMAEFAYSDTPRFDEARAIAAFACDLFLKREVDQVIVGATRFVSTLVQQPFSIEYLPVGEIKEAQAPWDQAPWDGTQDEFAGTTEILFEPGPAVVLGYLLSHYVNIYIYEILKNAKASEQSARMVAMKNATDNAEHLSGT